MKSITPAMWRDEDGDVIIATADGHRLRFQAPMNPVEDILGGVIGGKYVLFERVMVHREDGPPVDINIDELTLEQ